MSGKILVIDDDAAFRGMLVDALTGKGWEVGQAGSAEEGLRAASGGGFDLALLDVRLPGMTGIEAIPLLRQADASLDLIVMTAYSSKDSAIEALKLGASDYFTKPFSLAEMEVVIRRTLERRGLQRRVASLEKALGQESPLDRLIGESEPLRQVRALVEKLAPLDVTVLITGDSGTGKELVADVIHSISPRAKGPLIKVNCAAIPESLLESELFGHEKGAFTGATAARPGRFELAKGGSLLLDEIGDMPLHLQPKLLRAVEQKQVERVGGAKPVAYDVRIVAATNQDLAARMADGRFREDLYYRLNVAGIRLPALRERREDIPLLARHFLQRANLRNGTDIAGLDQEAVGLLFGYGWPGNIRQLANVMERAAIFSTGSVLTAADIRAALQENPRPLAAPVLDKPISLKKALQEVERSLIEKALEQSGGVQSKAARLLGISAKNLWNKLHRHRPPPVA